MAFTQYTQPTSTQPTIQGALAHMSAKQLNKKLKVVRLDNLRFPAPFGSASIKGWGLFIEGKGYLRFKIDAEYVPYSPCGGKKALEKIIADGGLLSYAGIEFINPIQ